MATKDNVMAAFAGESQANRKYLAFAKKAEADGFPQVARLFRAAAEAETIHAHAHLRVADGVKATAENLAEAVAGEQHEFTAMYPGFIKEAQAEGNKAAVRSFEYANAVEMIHYALYQQALAVVKGGRDLPAADIHVCPVCGNTVVGAVPATCPICGVPGNKFMPIA